MKIEKIFEELKKPDMPAEIWLKQRGIFVENKRSMQGSNAFKVRFAASILAVVMFCLAFILLFALSKSGPTTDLPKESDRFSATDIGTKPLSNKNEIDNLEELLFFDTNQILSYLGETSIIMQFVNEENKTDKTYYEEGSRIVGYYFFQCMVVNSKGNCFLINYQIRLNNLFDFINISDYRNLNELGEFNRTKVYYDTNNIQIDEQSTDVAFIAFNYEGIDYYMEISAGGLSYVHEEEVLKTLVRDLLGVAL